MNSNKDYSQLKFLHYTSGLQMYGDNETYLRMLNAFENLTLKNATKSFVKGLEDRDFSELFERTIEIKGSSEYYYC